VKKLLLMSLLFAGACRSRTTETPSTAPVPAATSSAMPGSSIPGASTPRFAVDAFLSAVKAQDLQALDRIWGNKDGPVRNSKTMTRQEVEQREIVLIRCFRHDSHRILSESPAADAERMLEVELVQGTSRSITKFFTTKSGDRWYVRSADMDPKRCSAK
jgi:hypothetical protein